MLVQGEMKKLIYMLKWGKVSDDTGQTTAEHSLRASNYC